MPRGTAGNVDGSNRGPRPPLVVSGLPAQQAAQLRHTEWSTAHDQARRKQV